MTTIIAARKSHCQSENSEKIKRALHHNLRPGCRYNFFTSGRERKHCKEP